MERGHGFKEAIYVAQSNAGKWAAELFPALLEQGQGYQEALVLVQGAPNLIKLCSVLVAKGSQTSVALVSMFVHMLSSFTNDLVGYSMVCGFSCAGVGFAEATNAAVANVNKLWNWETQTDGNALLLFKQLFDHGFGFDEAMLCLEEDCILIPENGDDPSPHNWGPERLLASLVTHCYGPGITLSLELERSGNILRHDWHYLLVALNNLREISTLLGQSGAQSALPSDLLDVVRSYMFGGELIVRDELQSATSD